MEDFKMCSDGEYMPVSLPCPPPYSGPYYYYPSDNIPIPPAGGSSTYESNEGGGAPISAGAVAGIIILVGFIIVAVCLLTIKFRRRLFMGSIVRLSSTTNARNMELHQAGGAAAELASTNGEDMLLDVVGGGLEEKLVNLLPVFQYVRLQEDGKQLSNAQQKLGRSSSCGECAVCLSLFEEKDIVRILPKCKHVFHLLCIDKWFESHANCPLCRERITLQTIQVFLMKSQDHAIDVDDHRQPSLDVVDDHHQQLAEFAACPNGPTSRNNNLMEDYNNLNDPTPHDYYSISCAAQPFDPCAPHDSQIDTPSNDGHQYATKPYKSTDLAEEKKHGHSTEFTSALLQEYPYHYQSFSFLTSQAAQSNQKEMSCVVDHTNHEAARSSPPLLFESNQPGVFTDHKMTRSHSQNERFGGDTDNSENSPIGGALVMSRSHHHSSRPLPELFK